MARPTQHPASRAARALAVTLLGFTSLSGCGSDQGEIESESVTTTTSTSTSQSSDGVEGSSTTGSSDTAPAAAASLPDSMWGVEAGSYDLIRIDTDSGDTLQRIPGWGADAGSGEQEGGAQALQHVAAEGQSLWIADCCEPAVGSVFRVDPGATTSVPDAEVRVYGTTPVLSPDGTRLAVAVLDIGVAVHDATTGEMLVNPELIGSVIRPPEGFEPPVFAAPASWIDDDTIAVAVNGNDTSTVTLVTIGQPSAPSAVGPVIEVAGTVIDGATRSDGSLVLAVQSPNGTTVAGHVYSTETGEQEATFRLDPATTAIDYDGTGTFLLVARENLPPAWQGLGNTGELGDTPLVFAAWDE